VREFQYGRVPFQMFGTSELAQNKSYEHNSLAHFLKSWDMPNGWQLLHSPFSVHPDAMINDPARNILGLLHFYPNCWHDFKLSEGRYWYWADILNIEKFSGHMQLYKQLKEAGMG
jgi:hypothetical protein